MVRQVFKLDLLLKTYTNSSIHHFLIYDRVSILEGNGARAGLWVPLT